MPQLHMSIWAAWWQNQQCGCAPSEDSDQPGHPPSMNRVFAVRMKKPWVLSYPLSAQWRLWSHWADVQADLSLRWARSHFVGLVTRRLIYTCFNYTFKCDCTEWRHLCLWHDKSSVSVLISCIFWKNQFLYILPKTEISFISKACFL